MGSRRAFARPPAAGSRSRLFFVNLARCRPTSLLCRALRSSGPARRIGRCEPVALVRRSSHRQQGSPVDSPATRRLGRPIVHPLAVASVSWKPASSIVLASASIASGALALWSSYRSRPGRRGLQVGVAPRLQFRGLAAPSWSLRGLSRPSATGSRSRAWSLPAVVDGRRSSAAFGVYLVEDFACGRPRQCVEVGCDPSPVELLACACSG